MKKFSITVFLTLLLLSPQQSFAQSEAKTQADLLSQIQVLLKQIETLQQLLATKNISLNTKSQLLPVNAVVQKRYQITAGNTVYIADQRQRALVERFLALAPDGLVANYVQFVFFTDTSGQVDAYVETDDGVNWRVGLNTELLKYPITDSATTELLVHEIGHIVELHVEGGNELRTTFKDEFWNVSRSRQSFVSTYADDGAGEDFAESFMYFVLRDNYRGIAAEKVHFFRRYPDLLKFKSEITSNI